MSLNNFRSSSAWSRAAGVLVLATMGFSTFGCTSGTILRSGPRLGRSTTIATSADVRLITSSPVTTDTGGDFVRPTQINCSEPSPDIAKIVSQAFGASGAFGGKAKIPNVPADADLNTTLALSKSYAEGIAQMTERLATIQLLRDSLYRACEAYANGAISATTYSAMVSRYDKTMITLLMGELAAGNFGRSLAAMSGATSAKSSAELALDEVTKRDRQTKENLDQKLNEKRDIERSLKDTPNTPENAATREALQKDSEEKSSEIARAKEDHQTAEDQLKRTLKAMTETSAQTTVTAAGAISKNTPEAAAAIAGDLLQMQANYLNDHNVDALKIACLNSFGRESVGLGDNPRGHHGEGEQAETAFRYNYGRALSVWCDELVETLKYNVADSFKASKETKSEVKPAMRELFMPDPHAFGPFFRPSDVSAPSGKQATDEPAPAAKGKQGAKKGK